MATVLQEQQPASFRGVPFLVNSESKTGGKKFQTHEFVNSNKRFTEEFGSLPPKFTIQAIIHGSIQERLNFERVLNIEGLGTLVHPVYGTIEVKSTTYTVGSNQTALGEFRFTINFETSEANVTATPAGLTNAAVTKAAEDARAAADTALEENYLDPEIPDTLESIAEKAEEIYDTVFESVSKVTGAVQEKVSTFTRVVNDSKSKVFTIVQNAATVKQATTDLYTSALNVVDTPSQLFDAWESILGFSLSETPFNSITVPRINKETNRSIMNEHTRMTGLISLFESAAYVTYKTDIELQKVKNLLDQTYNDQIERFTDSVENGIPSLAKNADLRKKISELRVFTRKVFDEQEQNIWRVVEIEPKTSSMLLTSYRYYGELDNFEFLKELNPEVNSANFKKPIQAVTR